MDYSFALPKSPNQEMLSLIDTQIRYLLPEHSEVNISQNCVVISPPGELSESLQTDIKDFIDSTVKSYRKVNKMKTLSKSSESTCSQDPMPHLRNTRQVIEATPGIFYYSGELLTLMSKLDSFIKKYALSIGASERLYPNILPVDSMINNGYISGFPHHALFISLSHQDTDSLKRVAKIKSVKELESAVAPNGVMLAPTVCHHCFEELKNAPIDENIMITSVGKCHRFEGPSAVDLSRTHVFNMREIVLFGSTAWVHKQRIAIKTFSEALFTNWGLAFEVETATDPFFPAGSQKKRNFQAINQTKFEIKLVIPHQSASISAVSVNNHMNTLTEAYNITGEQSVISSCVGFGLERLAYAILSQFGTEASQWPKSLRDDLLLDD